jgi:hypothetical protein
MALYQTGLRLPLTCSETQEVLWGLAPAVGQSALTAGARQQAARAIEMTINRVLHMVNPPEEKKERFLPAGRRRDAPENYAILVSSGGTSKKQQAGSLLYNIDCTIRHSYVKQKKCVGRRNATF